MGFLDKAKQAATDMAAKADQAMANAGILTPGAPGPFGGASRADGPLRDYGLIVWRDQHGHPVDATEKERVVNVLRAMETNGELHALRVGGSGGGFAPPPPGTPPPPPGYAAQQAAAAAAPAAPPSGAPAPPPSPAAAPVEEQLPSGGGTAPPPPPPSWAG